MEAFDQEYIESLIHFAMKDRETLVRYYAKLPEGARLLVHIFAGRYATKNRNRIGKLKAEFYYAAFLIGIAKVRHIEKKKDRKEKLSEADSVLAKHLNIARIDAKFREKSQQMRHRNRPGPHRMPVETNFQ